MEPSRARTSVINGHKTGCPGQDRQSAHRCTLRACRRCALGGTPGATPGQAKDPRLVHFPDRQAACETTIHDRGKLAAGETILGPAVIEQEDPTTLVPPGWHARGRCRCGAADGEECMSTELRGRTL